MNLPLSVRCALLQLLTHGPAYGLALIEAAQAATGGAVRLHQGAVYPALLAMEREGLICAIDAPKHGAATNGGKPRRTYSITAAGRALARQQRTLVLALVGAEAS